FVEQPVDARYIPAEESEPVRDAEPLRVLKTLVARPLVGGPLEILHGLNRIDLLPPEAGAAAPEPQPVPWERGRHVSFGWLAQEREGKPGEAPGGAADEGIEQVAKQVEQQGQQVGERG